MASNHVCTNAILESRDHAYNIKYYISTTMYLDTTYRPPNLYSGMILQGHSTKSQTIISVNMNSHFWAIFKTI